jgi:hypothetical protein
MRATVCLASFLLACGGASSAGSSSLPPRTRWAAPSSEPLMLGVASADDGRQGFSNLFFFALGPDAARCVPVDQTVDHGTVCTIRDCRAEEPGAPAGTLDAGVVSVAARANAAIRPDETGAYPLDGVTGERWDVGDALHFEATGGADVPAFSADLVMPALPTLLAPPIPPPDVPMPLMRTSPLTVRWEPFDGIAIAFLSMVPDRDDWWMHHLEMECLVDGADGAMVIPAELVERFRPEEDYFANFAFGARTYVDVHAGDRTLRVVAERVRSLDVEYE